MEEIAYIQCFRSHSENHKNVHLIDYSTFI